MVAQTLLVVTLHVHCLSCSILPNVYRIPGHPSHVTCGFETWSCEFAMV